VHKRHTSRGSFPVGVGARGFQQAIRVLIIAAVAVNIIALLLLCFGVYKPRKTIPAGQTTPAPTPKDYAMPLKLDDAPAGNDKN